METFRYKILVEYNGSNYCGFQKQFDVSQKSIEGVLEVAIFKLSQEEVKIIASGRTDAGVHALGQVVCFDLNKKFDPYKIVMGLNNYLREEDVVILDCFEAAEGFHPRFDAKMRHYHYRIINRSAPLTLQKNQAWHVSKELDIAAMTQASKFLIGLHDFSSFRDTECQSKTAIRSISEIEITKSGDEILIAISAKSFLHHMVRNIVGTLAMVGRGKILSEEMKVILEAKDRTKSGPNAPACGLYFLGVEY